MIKKIIVINKIINYKYKIISFLWCGIILQGLEIKSIRKNKINLKHAYVLIKNNELFMHNAVINLSHKPINFDQHKFKIVYKLLANKNEILKLSLKQKQYNYVLIPSKAGFNTGGYFKIQIALAEPLKKYDQRENLKKKDLEKLNKRFLKYY